MQDQTGLPKFDGNVGHMLCMMLTSIDDQTTVVGDQQEQEQQVGRGEQITVLSSS